MLLGNLKDNLANPEEYDREQMEFVKNARPLYKPRPLPPLNEDGTEKQ